MFRRPMCNFTSTSSSACVILSILCDTMLYSLKKKKKERKWDYYILGFSSSIHLDLLQYLSVSLKNKTKKHTNNNKIEWQKNWRQVGRNYIQQIIFLGWQKVKTQTFKSFCQCSAPIRNVHWYKTLICTSGSLLSWLLWTTEEGACLLY